MRAFAVGRYGEAPAILDLPVPRPDPARDFLVRVAVAGVNPIDVKRVDALTSSSVYPHVPGIDFAGVVEHAPPGDHGLRVGDRVFGMARRTGTYAEYTLVSPTTPGEALARLPDAMDFEQAACLPVAGVAALGGLMLLGIKAGHTLAIVGATGAVGRHAMQLAADGEVHVIAITRSDPDKALCLGAKEAYAGPGSLASIQAAHPDGIDGVLDLVNTGEELARMARIIRRGGGIASAQRAANVADFARQGVIAHNIGAAANPAASQHGLDTLARQLRSYIGLSADLSEAVKVLARVRGGTLRGKATLRIGP